MEAIEIHDLTKTGTLAVQLQDLLPHIEQRAGGLEFYLIEFDVVLMETSKYSLSDVQARIEQSPEGLPITWAELHDLAAEIFDIQDLTIVGCAAGKRPLRSSTFQSLCASCNVVVECFDSTFWRICADDQECIRSIRDRFSDVREVVYPNNGAAVEI